MFDAQRRSGAASLRLPLPPPRVVRGPPSTNRTRFFIPLESLRGIAALTVVVFHAVWSNPVTQLRFFQNGALMVDFFFVLSGFVIYHSYGAQLATVRDIARFLWLRLGRLYPLHVAFLLVFLGFEIAKFYAQRRFGLIADKPAFVVNDPRAFVANLLLIHSLGVQHSLTYNYPSWSISTEFYAYVLFAAVRSICCTTGRFVAAAILIIAVGFAILLAAGVPSLANAGYDWGFFRCAVGFFLGALTCIAYHRFSVPRPAGAAAWRAWLGPLALLQVVALMTLATPDGRATYLMPLASALLVFSIVLAPDSISAAMLSVRPLRWLGRVSYSVYMSHAAVVWTVTQVLIVVLRFPKTVLIDGHGVATPSVVGVLVLIIYVGIVLLLSGATYRLIEEPFRRRSRQLAARWFAEDGAVLSAAAP